MTGDVCRVVTKRFTVNLTSKWRPENEVESLSDLIDRYRLFNAEP